MITAKSKYYVRRRKTPAASCSFNLWFPNARCFLRGWGGGDISFWSASSE